ncbi:MAG TPA: DUF4190 domain-containing protein [Streptosporangiaceae bacterium]|nr:DUF4190 domain-containing protein [Streptosporangiaceae bacterium]
MVSPQWNESDEAQNALRAIVSNPVYGVAALSSSQMMANLLKDLLPDAPREVSILVAAAEAGVAASLRDRVSQGMDVGTASAVVAGSFAASTPFKPEACNWAVSEIAGALGLARPAAGPGPASGPGPAAGPGPGSSIPPGGPGPGSSIPPEASKPGGSAPTISSPVISAPGPAPGSSAPGSSAPGGYAPGGWPQANPAPGGYPGTPVGGAYPGPPAPGAYPGAAQGPYPGAAPGAYPPSGFPPPSGSRPPGQIPPGQNPPGQAPYTPASPFPGQGAGGYQSPPVPGYWQQPPAPGFVPVRTTNGLAIASLVLGVLWLVWLGSLVGLILGLVALKQIKNRNQGGRGIAIAGIVLSVLWLVGFVVAIIVGGSNGS